MPGLRRLIPVIMAITLATAGASMASPRADEFPDPAQFEVGSRDWLRATEALKYRPLFDDMLTENCPHSFDVLHYDITMFIDTDAEEIFGDTEVTAVSQEPALTTIDLDLAVLTVDSVFCGGDSVGYVHVDSVLTIDLDQAYASGDTFVVRVIYHGTPGNEGPAGFGGFYFTGAPIRAFHMGVGLEADPPSMGKFWVPCWDWPCDKATAEYHITVPGTGKKVICNGMHTGTEIDSVGGTTTWHWSETHQIAPHLMTVHAGRYAELVDSTYSWIYYWVYPPKKDDAGIHFQNVDIMMDGFIDRYGPYPFDKFSYVAASKGDMEHQTCVTHVASVINPDHLYDWLLAHEMAHQWWGDLVSVNTWKDIWLSEGFATYSEAIFQEHAYGMSAYHNYVQQSLMNPALNTGENFPVYDPNYLWGTTVYEKGACVLHMLRHVLTDSVFFAALEAYKLAHEHESATSAQFQQDVEAVCGQSLTWFFDQWIYDVGYPEYEYSWLANDNGGTYDLNLVIDQVQTNGPVFAMPVDIGVSFAGGDSLLTLWVDDAHEDTTLSFAEAPLGIELDPDNWILNTQTEVPHAGATGRVAVEPEVRLEQNIPNPFSPLTRIRFSVPRSQEARLEVYSATGQRVTCLLDRSVAPGWNEVVWTGRDEAGREVAPGAYFCRLTTDDATLTRRMVLLR
jgi:aminopeptidase N